MVWKIGVQSQVESYQRLENMVLDATLLTIQHYRDRVKWSNTGNGVVPSTTPRRSSYLKGSFGSPSTKVANFTYLFDPEMGPKEVLPLQVRVDLGLMVMEYCTLPRTRLGWVGFGLVWFDGKSTTVGFLMPNPVFTYIRFWFGLVLWHLLTNQRFHACFKISLRYLTEDNI